MEAASLPVLRGWLDGKPQHPLRYYFGPPPGLEVHGEFRYEWWRSPILTTVEEILTILERAQPPGLPSKRRDFRALKGMDWSNRDRFSELRTELAVGAALVESGVGFRFNPPPGPDLLVDDLSGGEVAIEIGSRAPIGFSAFCMDVVHQLLPLGLDAHIHLMAPVYPPVSIRADVRERIMEKILDLVSSDAPFGAVNMIAIPERPELNAPACPITIQYYRQKPGEGLKVTSQSAAPISGPQLKDTVNEVARRILRDDRKRRQAGTEVPTVLLAEVSRCDLGIFRSESPWASIFDEVWCQDDRFVAVGATLCYQDQRVPEIGFSVNRFAPTAAVRRVVEALSGCPQMSGLADQAERVLKPADSAQQ